MKDSWLFPYAPLDVAAFLRRINSPRLADMVELPSWVEVAAREFDINPRWLLTLIQKEQSGLTLPELSSHAKDWLLGFGYTEGPIYSQFKGARTQVFSAASGLRRYLTPGDKLYVGGWIGKRHTYDGLTRTVENIAMAAALQYTPHWWALNDHISIYRRYFGGEEVRALATTRDVERVARRICAAFAAGNRGTVTIGQVTFNLRDVAMCSRFVRECCEAAAGTEEYGPLTDRYFRGTALLTERALKEAGCHVGPEDVLPGDIVCFNAGKAGSFGHIGIYLSDGEFAENTSSPGRGPGFVISRFDQIGHERISGFYHLPEFARAAFAVVVDGEPLPRDAYELRDDGVTWVRLRALAEAAGLPLGWEPHTQTVTVGRGE